MRWSQTLSIPCLSFVLIPLTSLLCLLLSTPTNAQQAFTPIPYFYSHSNFIEKVALYVHGGKTNTNANSSDQTFYLDLSRPWSTSSPVFISIASKFPSQGTTSTLINNNSEWLMIYDRTAYTYTFRNARWSKPTVDPNLNSNPNMPMVFDPTQKQVYIINGYVNATDDGVLGAMRYDPSVPTVMNPMRESTRLLLDGGYAAVWSTALNVVIAYGGFVRSTPPTYSETLYEFNPQNPKFLSMGGTNSPAARYGHCMVEAYGGSQIILFGGVDQNNSPLSDLHILDVATLTWTQQKVDLPPLGRAYPCCAVTNDMFVAWSGAQWDKGDGEFKVIDKEITIVFNLKTKQWQSTFSPDPVVLPTSAHGNTTTATVTGHPTASATKTPAAHEVSVEAVVGGAIAGLAVVLVGAAGLLYTCRMRAKKKGWTWKLLSRKDDSLPPLDQKNLTNAAVAPAGSSVAEEAALNSHSRGGDNDDGDDHDGDRHSLHGAGTKSETTSLKSEALSGYGFRIGKHNFVQLEPANSSEAGRVFQMVQIHNPVDILSSTSLSTSQEKQQQKEEEPLMSTSTVCLIPCSPTTSPTTPHSNASQNTSIMSVAAAFAPSASPARSEAPSTQTSVAVSTGSVGGGISVVAGELDEQWAAAAVALAKEGETRVERGERRNPHVPAKKANYIDSLDLSEYEKLVIPARHPQVLIEVEE
ncbi:hypothetical protein BGZ89_001213 [Linnemannia elongata]|nr:hypothetical protein BGZ89_001213 [Linnemannia elongata]